MKGKKGMLGNILATLIIILMVGYVIFYFLIQLPELKERCQNEFPDYDEKECVNNIKGIEKCEKFDAVWFETKSSLFGPIDYLCIKDEKIIRI